MNHVLLDGVLPDQIVLYVVEVFHWEEEEQHQLQIEEYQDMLLLIDKLLIMLESKEQEQIQIVVEEDVLYHAEDIEINNLCLTY
tara:strand:- start:76 stop:327 length:252 start_codon:yes stop_codon:yes gene_type:complete